ncbi:hypothetical protein PLESTM_001212400 [Pleodorina starrii]|nr:hypothetical protein PLESTM_001212400 [Pleodorina starrii]
MKDVLRRRKPEQANNASSKVQIEAGVEVVQAEAKHMQSACPSTACISAVRQPEPPAPSRQLCTADFSWVRIIGAGAFGRVWLARFIPTGEIVAIKMVSKAHVIRTGQMAHVMDERAMLARVAGHPFLVNLLATFQDLDCLYFVMNYVPGGEFFAYVRDHGRQTEERARFYVAQIVLALEYLHARRIAYRDLKPENLLIDASGYLRLTDLGFAKVVKGRTHTLCGTPDYMAPEVLTGEGYTPAVDWWSLGCVIYEMLDGFPPFYSRSAPETYARIRARDLVLPHHMSVLVRDLVDRLLHAIKDHPWFTNLDWGHVATKAYAAPYIPPLRSLDDTCCFDRFDHLPPLESGAGLAPIQQACFKDF